MSMFDADRSDLMVLGLSGLGATGVALSQAQAFALLRSRLSSGITDDNIRNILRRVYIQHVMAKANSGPSNKAAVEAEVEAAVKDELGYIKGFSYRAHIKEVQQSLADQGYVIILASELTAPAPAAPPVQAATGAVNWPESMSYWKQQTAKLYAPLETSKPYETKAVQSVFTMPTIEVKAPPPLKVPDTTPFSRSGVVTAKGGGAKIVAVVAMLAGALGLVWYASRRKRK